ncbi:hypothetical protein WAI453_006292 [Rhynchosporium graminicola]|uniref:EKC/KEOPS complex subunit GON7 n=1 Tax=Rhynchosporium graminicola TaxID=2792576 RepID=A0A1E1L9I4_9HELO|nr:uncharacterized protein RCO7_03293 [Rhynchosporium commune]
MSPSPPPPPTDSPSTSTSALKASYSSPTNKEFAYSTPLPPLSTSSSNPLSASLFTVDKTAYLSALMQATSKMQEDINRELTKRMEEDNLKAAAVSGEVKGGMKVDEKKEEENYGEEVVEED